MRQKRFPSSRAKKKGKYVILKIDPSYEPPELETREVFGIMFEQRRNNVGLDSGILKNIVTQNCDLPDFAERDILVATITLKYTQSNSICFAYDGQVIGVGAGQQSRIHCTRLAASKVDTWYLRQHPSVLNLRFKKGVSRAERNNAVDKYLLEDLTPAEQKARRELSRTVWETVFEEIPTQLSQKEKRAWLDRLHGVSLSSDGMFPFRDSIDRAQQSGVRYVVQPGGSIRDAEVIQAADEYGMVMAFSGVRLFHH